MPPKSQGKFYDSGKKFMWLYKFQAPSLFLSFSVSVMRLTRPTLCSPVIVTSDSKDLPGNLLNSDLKHDITSVPGIETLSAGQFLLLPQSFG
jgi:hypothetical protein